MAVNQSNGHVYAIDITNDVIDVFSSSGNYLSTLDALESPLHGGNGFNFEDFNGGIGSLWCSLAIDNSNGPTQGRVYVLDIAPGKESWLSVFSTSGAFIFEKDLSFSFSISGESVFTFYGLTVDSSGNVHASASGGALQPPRLVTFDSSGNVIDARSVADLTAADNAIATSSVAVDSVGNTYVSVYPFGRLSKLPTGGGPASILDIAGTSAVAVNRVTDDVYAVDDRASIVSRYDSSGKPLGQFGLSTVDKAAGISVNDSSGAVYVGDPAHNRVAVFGGSTDIGVPDATLEPTTAITSTSATLNGSIDPQGSPASYRFQYRVQGTMQDWVSTPITAAGSGSGSVAVSEPVTGLAQNTTYDLRIQAVNTENGGVATTAIQTFTTDGLPQAILTISPPSEITPHGAQLSGTVNPNGSSATWRFEYTTDDEFAENWIAVGGDQSAGSGNSPVPVGAALTGLDPNTHYFLRVLATNAGGPKASPTLEFTTAAAPAEVRTVPAGAIEETSARLGASINPNKSPTTYYFEYGPDSGYGASVPISEDASAGSGFDEVLLTQEISGLEPETTYHYRVVAENAGGTSYGLDQRFRTDATSFDLGKRGLELVTSPEKGNQSPFVNGGVLMSPNGRHVTWAVAGGAPGGSSGAGGVFLAGRTPNGWTSKTLLPPAEDLLGAGSLLYQPIKSTPDFSRSVFLAAGFLGGGGLPRQLALVDRSGESVVQTELGEALPASDNSSDRTAPAINDDLSRVYVDTTSAAYDPEDTNKASDIYEFGQGTPKLVDRLPNGQVPNCGGEAFGFIFGMADNVGFDYWIARDPAATPRVYFESFENSGGGCKGVRQVYVRDVDAGTTTLVSGPPTSGPSEPAYFVRASYDGTEAVFYTATRLTPDDANDHPDIYRWSVSGGNECLTCSVPVKITLPNEPEDLNERGMAVSEDLSHVYFVSRNAAVAGAPKDGGIYVWSEGSVRFVARYKKAEGSPNNPGLAPFSDYRTYVTPDGDTLVFATSLSGVTADDTQGTKQVYRYDDTTGTVECMSCSPPGVEPGILDVGKEFIKVANTLSADGKTFAFATSAPLVEEDINQQIDVYEWHDGKVRLVTSGATDWPEEQFVKAIGVSPDAKDIYFVAPAQLTGHEADHTGQVYDARLGGGFPVPVPPAPCVEDACQGPLSAPPNLASPGSRSLGGPRQVVPRRAKARHCARSKKHARKAKAGCSHHKSKKRQSRGGRS